MNEVTKGTAEALPNRSGKLLNVDGDLYKDDGSKLVKVVNNDSKSTNWGLIYRGNHVVSDWTVTGDADVSDSTLDGSYLDSFRVDTGTAGNTATIEHVIPPAAIDVRYNQAVIEYQLYDINDPVICTVLDWNDNKIGQVELPKTGSAPAVADNIRFSHATVDFTFPFSHGSVSRTVKFQFECASDINAGQFLVNFIQSDSNPRAIGQWVESESYSALQTATGAEDTLIQGNINNDMFVVTNPSSYVIRVDFKRACSVKIDFSNVYSGNPCRSSTITRYNGSIIDGDADYNNSALTGISSDSNINMRVNADDYIEIENTERLGTFVRQSLFITATANRRSIMTEADRVPDIVTAKVTPTDVIENENYEGFITGVSRLGSTVTITFVEQEDTPTFQATLSQNPSGGLIQPENVVVTTNSISFDQRNSANATVSLDYSWNIAICRSKKDIGNLKQAISIPVDEIIADGNERPVFGKFITVGGVKYQVFRKYDEASNFPLTLPQTAVVLGDWVQTNPSSGEFYRGALTAGGTSTVIGFEQFDSNTVTSNYTLQGDTYSFAGLVKGTDYYDTARPLYS